MLFWALAACTSDVDDSGAPSSVWGEVVVALPAADPVDLRVPSSAEPGTEMAVRLTWEPQRKPRYADGRPVILVARGSLGAGTFLDGRSLGPWLQAGFVVVEVILPGGSDEGQTSTGTFDTRGPIGQSAFADAALYAAGRLADTEGRMLADRVPDALDWIGVVGMSNGVNFAWMALDRRADELDAVRFFVGWEGPYTDQFLDVELESYEFHLNPAYELGSCTDTDCPMPELPAMLQFDATAESFTEKPLESGRVDLPGILYVDEDGSGTYASPEYWWHMVSFKLPNGTYVCTPSVELSTMIDGEADRLFPDGERPSWLPTTEWLTTFWSTRDASLILPSLAEKRPDLPIIVAASREDHIYLAVPDNPHIPAQTHFLIESGFSFVRLNPDAAYLAALSGISADTMPDNPPGQSPVWPDTPDWLEPELQGSILDKYTAAAAALELADRVHEGRLDEGDLDAPIFPVPGP